MKLRKGDTVEVISGKDGAVAQLVPAANGAAVAVIVPPIVMTAPSVRGGAGGAVAVAVGPPDGRRPCGEPSGRPVAAVGGDDQQPGAGQQEKRIGADEYQPAQHTAGSQQIRGGRLGAAQLPGGTGKAAFSGHRGKDAEVFDRHHGSDNKIS